VLGIIEITGTRRTDMAATLDQTKMARNDLAVKMAAEIVKKAKHIAINRGITLAEYLSERIRPLVDQDFEEEMAKMLKRPEVRAKGSKAEK
jgi:hypothetical protein